MGEDLTFEEDLRQRMGDRGWSDNDLAVNADLDVSTIRRVCKLPWTRDQRRHQSVKAIDGALGAQGRLYARWNLLGPDSSELRREQVLGVRVDLLSAEVRQREFSVYRSTEKAVPQYPSPPLLEADAETRIALDEINHFPEDLLRRVGEAFGVARQLPSFTDDRVGRSCWNWLAEFRDTLAGTWSLPKAERGGRLDLLEELSAYLTMRDSQSLKAKLRTVDIVVVLCGRTDHDARVAEAMAVVETAIDEPPTIVILGSPPLLTTDSLLSEPDAVWHSLEAYGHEGRSVDLSRVICDGRAINFSECAWLAVGHASRRAVDLGRPVNLGLVAGQLSMRRGWWCFSRAFHRLSHTVEDLTPLPSTARFVVPARVDSPTRDRFEAELNLELAKLLYLLLSGLA